MAGVEIHANLTSQLISAALEPRPLVRSWPEAMEWGWWLPVVSAAIATMGSATAMTAYLVRSGGDILRTFGRYLSDEIVTTLLEDPEGQKLGGERRLMTILTSDLRGFTATSERLSPERGIKVLNFYLGRMAEVITRHNGTIDELMGDGLLILFGAPIRREDDAQRAVACAVEMQLVMETVNKTMEEKTMEEFGLSTPNPEDVTVKVIRKADNAYHFYISFTSLLQRCLLRLKTS